MYPNYSVHKIVSTFNNGGIEGIHVSTIKAHKNPPTVEELKEKCTRLFQECNANLSDYNKEHRWYFCTKYFSLSTPLKEWRKAITPQGYETVFGPKSTLDFCLELDKPPVFIIPTINNEGKMKVIMSLRNGTILQTTEWQGLYQLAEEDCEDYNFPVIIKAPWFEDKHFVVSYTQNNKQWKINGNPVKRDITNFFESIFRMDAER